MSLEKLTAADLATRNKTQKKPGRQKATNPYADFFKGIRVGQGGQAFVANEGISRPFLKLKITAAAQDAGVMIKFLSTGADEVKFKVTGRM